MLALFAASVLAVAGPPEVEVSRFDGQRIGYTVRQIPGVARAGTTFELAVRLEELFRRPDPVFGRRRMLSGAHVVVYLLDPKGALVDARLAAPDGDDGNFAAHFTPTIDGIYSAHVRGTTHDNVALDYAVLVNVNVWPMLDGLSPDPLPRTLPVATIGDRKHGEELAKALQLAPLSAEESEALDDETLLARVAPGAPTRPVDRRDLVRYLRSRTVRVVDLFARASAYAAVRTSLDADATARLAARGMKTPRPGYVFVVYAGPKPTGHLEPLTPTAARAMPSSERVGFVAYTSDGTTALAFDPSLHLVAQATRGRDGALVEVRMTSETSEARRALELVNAVMAEQRDRDAIDADLR